MADRVPTIKLLTNIGVTMTLRQVYYNHSADAKAKGWKAQLCLQGDVDGVKSRVYVPLGVGKDLTKYGWLEKGPKKGDEPTFLVTGSPRIVLLKSENGTQKLTTASPADGFDATDAAPQNPRPASTTPPKPVQTRPELGWQMMGDRYRNALQQAIRAFGEAGVKDPETTALHAAAATIMIAADRLGVTT
jgi:hypothetical protein